MKKLPALLVALSMFTVVITIGPTAIAMTGAIARDDNPWRKAPPAVKAKVLKQLELPGSPRCYLVYTFGGAASIGSITYDTTLPASVTRRCAFSDSNFFIQMKAGRWVRLTGLDGSSWECRDWNAALAEEDLPPAVEEYLKPNCYRAMGK